MLCTWPQVGCWGLCFVIMGNYFAHPSPSWLSALGVFFGDPGITGFIILGVLCCLVHALGEKGPSMAPGGALHPLTWLYKYNQDAKICVGGTLHG